MAVDLLGQLRTDSGGAGGCKSTKRLQADTVSFNATINALGRGGEWAKALALLREMSAAGGSVRVRFATFASLELTCSCRSGAFILCVLQIGPRRSLSLTFCCTLYSCLACAPYVLHN